MSDVFHPVVNYDYATLIRELDKRVASGYLNRVAGPDGLVLYNYTNSERTLSQSHLLGDLQIYCLQWPHVSFYGV